MHAHRTCPTNTAAPPPSTDDHAGFAIDTGASIGVHNTAGGGQQPISTS